MPPKPENKPSKKAVREKAANAIDEQSFGLKNKNKSKKVQQFIARVEKGVKNSTGLADAAKAKEAAKEAKVLKQLEEEQLRSLLNEGISNQFGKKKTQAQNTASKLGIAEATEEVTKILDEFSTDSDSDEEEGYTKKRRGPETYVIDDEPVAVEVFREKTIEDIIEEQRAKLQAEGKKGTPVTEESFARWRAAKLAKRQAEAEARVKVEQTKKKGGKGLSVLSGKELFNYNASLFVDDDAALDAKEEDEMNEEAKKQADLEEQQSKDEARRAQEEQERLQDLQRIELEYRERKYEEKRQRASDPNHPTIVIGDITINQLVFIEEEEEDLTPFPEIIFTEASEDAREGTIQWQNGSADSKGEGVSFEINMDEEQDGDNMDGAGDQPQDENDEDENNTQES